MLRSAKTEISKCTSPIITFTKCNGNILTALFTLNINDKCTKINRKLTLTFCEIHFSDSFH